MLALIAIFCGGIAGVYGSIASNPIWWVVVTLLLLNFGLFQVAAIVGIIGLIKKPKKL